MEEIAWIAGKKGQTAMTKWEYTFSQGDNSGGIDAMSEVIERLNSLGEGGWEVAAWLPGPSKGFGMMLGYFILKRPA